MPKEKPGDDVCGVLSPNEKEEVEGLRAREKPVGRAGWPKDGVAGPPKVTDIKP